MLKRQQTKFLETRSLIFLPVESSHTEAHSRTKPEANAGLGTKQEAHHAAQMFIDSAWNNA